MQLELARLHLAIHRKDWRDVARIMLDHFDLDENIDKYSYTVSSGSRHGPDIVMCLHSGRTIGWSKPTSWWDLEFIALGDRCAFRIKI